MGFYADHIFPRLMEWIMAGEEFRRLRAGLLAPVQGSVLELGVGTGLNLPHYPTTVARVAAVDPARLLPQVLTDRRARVPFPVELQHVSAEALPYGDRSFDFVVSTWTLCTIPDPVAALREAARVLKPSGRFLFLEHGRSDDPRTAAWQDRLNPIQHVVGCGCNLNRRIDELISRADLRIFHLNRFRMDHVPRFAGEMYAGTAGVTASDVR
jgi:ubiquinone/menaquinone biosynthesis C-methylase UbiE